MDYIEKEIARIRSLQQEIEELKEMLKAAEARKHAAEEHLAERMLADGNVQVRTASGTLVTVKQDVRGTWPKERAEEAAEWLREHGAEGIIKTQLTANFSPGFLDEAQRIAQELARRNFIRDVEVGPRVHPQTLWAYLREALAEGALDEEGMRLFNVFVRNTVSIKE